MYSSSMKNWFSSTDANVCKSETELHQMIKFQVIQSSSNVASGNTRILLWFKWPSMWSFCIFYIDLDTKINNCIFQIASFQCIWMLWRVENLCINSGWAIMSKERKQSNQLLIQAFLHAEALWIGQIYLPRNQSL